MRKEMNKVSGRKQTGGAATAAAGGLSSTSSPCAACKLLRRKCAAGDCVFAPYFPPDDPHKFANVHKVFGASNVNKMLQELPEHQRGDAVSSMVYEANARVRDPVYGCVGAISSLQHQIDMLQAQLAIAQAEVVHLRVRLAAMGQDLSPTNCVSTSSSKILMSPQRKPVLGVDMVVDQASYGESMWFDNYGKQGLLCGSDGLPHLIVSGDQIHWGEFITPGILFLYIAGWIGWVGRSYLIAIRDENKPTQKEIIIDVPLASSLIFRGFIWPVAAYREYVNRDLIDPSV